MSGCLRVRQQLDAQLPLAGRGKEKERKRGDRREKMRRERLLLASGFQEG